MSETWSRPRWTPASDDAQARVLFLVFGASLAELAVSRSRHHLAPDGPHPDVVQHAREDNPAWFDGWLTPELCAAANLAALGEAAERVRQAASIARVSWSGADQDSLAYLQNAIGFVSAVAETAGSVAILDAISLRWWSLDAWRRAFVDSPERSVRDHAQLFVSDDDAYHPGLWAHTRGLIQFGRPDIQIRHIPIDDRGAVDAAAIVINAVADYLASGARIADGETMDFPGLPEARARFRAIPDDADSTSPVINNRSLVAVDAEPAAGQPPASLRGLLARLAAQLEHR